MSSGFTVDAFIRKWRAVELKERSAAQEHFIDVCRMLGEPTPAEADPDGEFYCFERGATKTSGGEGWADVWKRNHFGWEYKGKRKNLEAAFGQLQQYALALENPPLLVVCDLDHFVIRTNWTNTVSEKHEFALEELREPRTLQKLKWTMSDPERLRPGKTRQDLTEDAAAEFATLAQGLRSRGHDPGRVAHFVNRLVFCMFAEDADLLPNRMFVRMLEAASVTPTEFERLASTLFAAMKSGGLVGFERIEWFNGGLFDDDHALPLTADDIALCLRAAAMDWSEIDPSIFGTLFVRGLDPEKRSETGSEYTDRDKIMMIIEPVITRPLLREWEAVKSGIVATFDPARQAVEEAIATASGYPELAEEVRAVESRLTDRPQLELFGELAKQRRVRAVDSVRSALRAADRALAEARDQGRTAFTAFLARLLAFRVLDPACGSGNFLYLALVELKNLERRVAIEGELLGFPPTFPAIGPEALLGIEINPYAAELARVSVWIGEIQWMRRSGFDIGRRPILKPLTTIECRNAIVNVDGTAALWPDADVIVGNPPYLGAKLMKRRLGVEMTEAIRALYVGRLPGFTDFVCYWFENARAMIEAGEVARAGLVATNSIRKNTNLPVLHRISATTRFFEVWSEEQWTVDGAAVDVSLVCFGDAGDETARLDGEVVPGINADFTTGLDLTAARPLLENRNSAFLGIQKSGPFDVPGEVARAWIREPGNPNGRSNAEVLKPYWNGDDVTARPRDMWFIDLPLGLSKADASLFASPFHHIATTRDDDGKTVEQLREALGERAGPRWWEPHWPRPEMRSRIEQLGRYIVTAETAQHRLFVWLSYPVLPDKNLIVIPRDDDLMFGLLHSRFHAAWALRKGSDLEDRPRYTHTTTFATFPFPEGMSPDVRLETARAHAAAPAIETAAARLNNLRNEWLYPSDMIVSVPEIVPSCPGRLLPKDAAAARVLARRTLTALYNERPEWLTEAHRALDASVAAAYGWPIDISNDEALRLLLDLNLERSR
ncbi:DNA methyltransferase [Mesorhizobium sp.]|uniref:class I SAM-dependent DNA methyltransferase n=1 Tax=Mesorhizobium sp. TaxID=1871066 RepID=UPI000FE889FB|nr:DNA methyltransferase [Mesorhizobium sp.]RWL18061.1 MAG: class I SAM-dependent DNA methyltransferase [Mesorhizobium sp.]TIP70755.1 MAG: class I SAM-dependent DNA methyltransferase [Mesorhizobium sp.]TIQ16747.1 MAG: class I SAM-dependent DNA methyltransferase [Mesorhizobium sp.]TJV95453.1 MAG: class I SAM-dependent DNA methyltransferase [Mesorhizobium sp.]